MRPKRLPRAKLATLFPLTSFDLALLADCAHSVWDNIGFDVLQAMPRQEMKRRDVIEVVVDADRLADEVRRHQAATPALRALFPVWWTREAADYRDLLLHDIFTDRVYGL